MANERQIAPTSEGAKGPTDFQQLLRLRAEADKPGAPPRAVESLRRFLAEPPKLLDEVEIMAATTRSALVNKIGDQPGLRVLVGRLTCLLPLLGQCRPSPDGPTCVGSGAS